MATGDPRQVLESNLLTEIYGQAMMVMEHPVRDCPLVLPVDN